MADLLIKGMDMPTMPETFKQAERVPYIDVRIFADGTAVTSKCERPYYIQYSAVPVPPHGRLIDADELLKHKGDCYDHEGHLLYAVGTGGIMIAPTVIEASEVEQDGKL